jgi:hypothetical protein
LKERRIAGQTRIDLRGRVKGATDTAIKAGEAGGVLVEAVHAIAGIIVENSVDCRVARDAGSTETTTAGEAGRIAGRTAFRGVDCGHEEVGTTLAGIVGGILLPVICQVASNTRIPIGADRTAIDALRAKIAVVVVALAAEAEL